MHACIGIARAVARARGVGVTRRRRGERLTARSARDGRGGQRSGGSAEVPRARRPRPAG
jgi:hypothetical protein